MRHNEEAALLAWDARQTDRYTNRQTVYERQKQQHAAHNPFLVRFCYVFKTVKLMAELGLEIRCPRTEPLKALAEDLPSPTPTLPRTF